MQMMTGVNHVDGDKDDVQSLVHALMYQDKIDIVGIASSTSQHQPGANDERFVHLVIDQYAKDQSLLKAHDGGFKTAAELHEITYQGTQKLAGSSGYPAATEASAAIIKEAREAAAAGEVLYVATWGGLGDVARALHDAPDIAKSIRLLSASGPAQESEAYDYIKDKFAGKGDLWWVDAQTTQRGIYASPAEVAWPPVLILIVANTFFLGLFGQTPGMRLVRIRCASYPDGGVIGLRRGLIRGVLLGLFIPAMIMDGQGRGLHDRAAGSIVAGVRRS